ncbi:glycosyl hydrolase family 65 protein [Paludisphaera mucosa]|uniref:Glycosyl hydrolase family 65 protein n=1 Tax=Paludisphaera mucosa TaxID=3030827 RepID=A0ABT6FA28_9BACT|nr:glycosyl hydrolase family 65 protein [Paludisphaera mucosa]MDG3004440.1 glycosyl hydrolase family 65 protein [Paludisphaera mucosa]
MSRRTLLALALALLAGPAASAAGGEPPAPADDFPRFVVPGEDAAMARMQELFRLHHGRAATDCTLWDAWLPHATLWPAVGSPPSSRAARDYYRNAFLTRRIDDEGYVAMQQHRGLAHSDGWPFPTIQQAGGVGWYFSTAGETYLMEYFPTKALANADGWEIRGAVVEGIDPERGLKLRITEDAASIATPAFACKTLVAPYVRLEWGAEGLKADARPSLSWLVQGEADWKADRRIAMAAPPATGAQAFANVPLYRQPGYLDAAALTRVRFQLDAAKGATVTLKSIISAIDTRHPITNINFVRGTSEYFDWTTDLPFLRAIVGRMRGSLRYALREFGVEEHHLVRVPWAGHDGRTGLAFGPGGEKTLLHGTGVGNNYWDLLPFGGDDGLATIYLYDALRLFADVEAAIAAHPEWAIPADGGPFPPEALRTLAAAVKAKFGATFWEAATGRFAGWRDRDGKAYDYGFVFVNTEAVAYGLATDEQARAVFDWLDGRRVVAGDTSQGEDIYHWRFGPRSTTRRNVETYTWVWSNPEGIPWGGQVQDGGAVLGFSYFDVMGRLRTLGPDDAWKRLRTILDWFGEVQSEGGYRAYYAKPGRGTLQGGGPAGGLGLDQEFMESVLVPQVMLYGFLGVEPRPGGLKIDPRLPSTWPSLTITRVQAQGHVLDLAAEPDVVRLTARVVDGSEFSVWLPEGRWEVTSEGAAPRAFTSKGEPQKLKFGEGATYQFRRLKD